MTEKPTTFLKCSHSAALPGGGGKNPVIPKVSSILTSKSKSSRVFSRFNILSLATNTPCIDMCEGIRRCAFTFAEENPHIDMCSKDMSQQSVCPLSGGSARRAKGVRKATFTNVEPCHSELVSESATEKMLKRVQHDIVEYSLGEVVGERGQPHSATSTHVKQYNTTKVISKHLTMKGEQQMFKRIGFTLAEVLITLAIIGIVAAITIPALVTKINEKVKENQISVIEKRFSEGMRLYSTQDSALSGKTYENTEEFVRGLSQHFKMTTICGKDNLAACWPYKTINYGKDDGTVEQIDVNELNLKNLSLNEENYYEPAGFISGAGVPYIVALKKDCTVDPDSLDDKKENPMSCIAGVYDYNGTRVPNKQSEDVIGMGGAHVAKSGMTYGGVKIVAVLKQGDFSAVSSSDCNSKYKKSGGSVAQLAQYCLSSDDDMWLGAAVKCHEAGGRLPNESELEKIATAVYGENVYGSFSPKTEQVKQAISDLGLTNTGSDSSPRFSLWAQDEYSSYYAYHRYFLANTSNYNDYDRNDNEPQALCVAK